MPLPRFRKPGQGRYGKRHKPGEMNQTEKAYSDLLEARKVAGEVEQWYFEAVTFKLAKDCRITPDFVVYLADGTMEFVDTKGGGPVNETSKVKMRCAAEKFPQFAFVMEQRLPKKLGGGWQRTEF